MNLLERVNTSPQTRQAKHTKQAKHKTSKPASKQVKQGRACNVCTHNPLCARVCACPNQKAPCIGARQSVEPTGTIVAIPCIAAMHAHLSSDHMQRYHSTTSSTSDCMHPCQINKHMHAHAYWPGLPRLPYDMMTNFNSLKLRALSALLALRNSTPDCIDCTDPLEPETARKAAASSAVQPA